MLKKIPFAELGEAQHGWLHARHHFSFANYYDPDRMGFGTLRVINDDIIQPSTGFGVHPHDNMEIITYVRRGAISHRDSNGNAGKTGAGDVQVMSAGTGIQHSEHNLEKEATNLFQIWITPNQRNVKPRWEAKEFPKEPVTSQLNLLVSGDGDAPLFIHQDARIYAGRMLADSELTQAIKHQAYILVSEGKVEIDGVLLERGDGAEITERPEISILAKTDAEVLVLDVPAA